MSLLQSSGFWITLWPLVLGGLATGFVARMIWKRRRREW